MKIRATWQYASMDQPGAKKIIKQVCICRSHLYHQIAWKGKVQVKKVDNKNLI